MRTSIIPVCSAVERVGVCLLTVCRIRRYTVVAVVTPPTGALLVDYVTRFALIVGLWFGLIPSDCHFSLYF